MPVTSRSRSGSASMMSNTFSPKALTIFLAYTGPIPRTIPEPRYFSTSTDGIQKDPGSGMIRGIGPVYAKKKAKAFGEKVFDIIEAEPDRLREVTGIGAVRARRITEAWADQKIVREIMVFLHSHGVGTARAVRIFKTYGADAVQVMTENPYRLARDILGIVSPVSSNLLLAGRCAFAGRCRGRASHRVLSRER